MTIDKWISDLPGTSRPGTAGAGTPPAEPSAAPPIEFRLDTASRVPAYLQLVHQAEHALRLGYLKPGDQLPTVRNAVSTLAISPNTGLKTDKDLATERRAAGLDGDGIVTLPTSAMRDFVARRRVSADSTEGIA
jgi:DNA-binding transcriptional regulator YhcF (GntR family)